MQTDERGNVGQPIVKYDPAIVQLDESGNAIQGGGPGCNATENYACTCANNIACSELERYTAVPAYLHEVIGYMGLGGPGMKGIY